MVLTTSKEVLEVARREGYAVGLFAVDNLEILQAVASAAEEENSPVIIGTSPRTIKYMGIENAATMIRNVGSRLSVPVILHLDHGKDLEIVRKCVENRYTSVMIDGSHLDFEENIAIVKKAVDIAHPKNVPVEAELGRIQKIGEIPEEGKKVVLTDPEAACEFVERTEVDALAVGIGTSHGAFKGEVKLDLDRLKAISDRVKIPLVLHGASGIYTEIIEKCTKYGAQLPGAKGVPDEDIKKAISLGISKINIATDIRLAFTAAIRQVLDAHPEIYDPRKILGPGREAMKEVIKHKMKLFGSSGKGL